MKVGFISLGCSKNLVDSEKMMGMLTANGHTLVAHPSQADAIVINTCGFITSAKEEAISTIFEMAAYKQANLKKLIVVGCLAQRYKEQLEEEIPEIDAVVRISDYGSLHEVLARELNDAGSVTFAQAKRQLTSKPWTAYLKIAEGCSNHCAYCAIPLIRGDNVSVPMEKLVSEAKELAKRGVKELVLNAQDTTKYGVDLYGRRSLLPLLQQLHAIEGFHWIRILYMYPDEIDDELIEGMAGLPKVLPYFDIPMQHADRQMLERMNRRGTKEDVLKLVEKIRSTFADPTLRTTFIVGFPGENRETMDELLQFVREVRWDRMGAFTYSPEEDTPGSLMKPVCEESLKQQYLDELMKLQEQIAWENQQKKLGKVIEVLVEDKDGLTNRYRGRSAWDAPDEVDGMVIFRSDRAIEPGTFVQVRITEVLVHDVIGVEV
ncbi:30S ribosomal protein S12 methylthiotransferase RimO [Amedibacillus dolichus]|uniref:Ribosomal protein uS12 methylthiotransferase RimO n=1 Tax=Amedibacillus dolichus TaxID=31971 RepID=A0ABT7UCA4_9FIRM|nr:30S ribosomal protein S12 methylthiotransferase RimO [Amedibacillus dolichus]MDM8157251.1 30S ribosomal protein S12 methylthiotransferase RimO [Amedibacillus dolichus]